MLPTTRPRAPRRRWRCGSTTSVGPGWTTCSARVRRTGSIRPRRTPRGEPRCASAIASTARPPTGRQNLRATYRKRLGLAGRVTAGQLNVLMSRPLGLIGAVNSLPSSGGADPEPPEGIRQNAPLTVRTLDRAVSAINFQDFAQGYAGIAKAEARLLASGVTQTVHLTVAAEEGEQILPGSALHDGLPAAIASHADPYRRVLVSSYRPPPPSTWARGSRSIPTSSPGMSLPPSATACATGSALRRAASRRRSGCPRSWPRSTRSRAWSPWT